MTGTGRTGWCKRCGIHLALEAESYVCPVCRDKARLQNEDMYKQ